MEINLLVVTSFANIFSNSEDFFVLFMASFVVQKLLSVLRSYLSFVFIFIILGGGSNTHTHTHTHTLPPPKKKNNYHMIQQSHCWSYTQRPHNLKGYMHPNVHGIIIYNSQNIKATQMSINRGMDIQDVVHIYSGVYIYSGVCITYCEYVLSHFSRVWLFAALWTAAHPTPPPMEFSRKEY